MFYLYFGQLNQAIRYSCVLNCISQYHFKALPLVAFKRVCSKSIIQHKLSDHLRIELRYKNSRLILNHNIPIIL